MMRATTVLWDIDGTLLRSGAVAPLAFLDAVAEVTGARPTAEGRDYGGRLDTEIAEMLLAAVGADLARVPDVLEALRRLVFERLGQLQAQTRTYPGVDALLARLAAAGVRQTVVTGNLAAIARHKLEAGGLIPPIELDFGGFGDSAANSRRRRPGGTRASVGGGLGAGPGRGLDRRGHTARPRLRPGGRPALRAGGNRASHGRGTGRPGGGHRAARPVRPAAPARALAAIAAKAGSGPPRRRLIPGGAGETRDRSE